MRRRRWQVGMALAMAASVVAATVGVASAAPGDLDTSFGTGGRVTGLVGEPEDLLATGSTVLHLTSDNVADGEGLRTTLRVTARTATGGLDTSWFGNGQLEVDLPGTFFTTGRLLVDGSGRLVVLISLSQGSDQHRIYRFHRNGDLDTTFSGDGVAALPRTVAGFPQVIGLGSQPDGDLVLGLNDTMIMGGFFQLPQLVRLTSTGTVAQTVDVLPDFTGGAPARMVVDEAGRPHVLIPDAGRLTVQRYSDALALDPTFSGDGRAEVMRPSGASDDANWGGDLAVAADGSVLLTGTVGLGGTQQATLLARLTATGAADAGFDGDGIAVLARPTGAITPVSVVRSASGGAVVVAARDQDGNDTATVVWQLTATGSPETGFSADGRAERSTRPAVAVRSESGERLYVAEDDDANDPGWQLSATSLVAPPAASAPGAPTNVRVASAGATTAQVTFTGPAANGGSALTGFTVQVFEGTSAAPARTVPVAVIGAGTGSHTANVSELVAGNPYRFRVVAANAIGTGPASAASGFAVPPFTTTERFVRQQYADLTGKAPTSAQLADLKNRVETGAVTPAAAVVEVSERAEWSTLDPLTRIYYAYFNRIPDSGGLKYWLGKRRSGMTVTRISDQFAASSEFRNTYGSLSNRAFVQLVYQNVLGRPADTAGLNSWTGKLDRRSLSRGGVMVQFSESNEHKNRRRGEVGTVSMVFGLLQRAPTTAELTTWSEPTKTSKVPLAAFLLGTAAYDARIPAS